MSIRRLAHDQPESFEFTPENQAWAQATMAKYPPGRQRSAIIPLLWRAQEQHGGWLPKPAIELVADMLGMPYIRALENATFYTMFNLEPVGQHQIQVCTTTPCWLRGSDDIVNVCKRRISPEQHHVSEDGLFSWIEVECMGACVNAPMVMIHDEYFEDLRAESFEKILEDLALGRQPQGGPQIARQTSAPIGGPTTLKDIKA
jgi:NADH-quinone oxidoreductase subunit E